MTRIVPVPERRCLVESKRTRSPKVCFVRRVWVCTPRASSLHPSPAVTPPAWRRGEQLLPGLHLEDVFRQFLKPVNILDRFEGGASRFVRLSEMLFAYQQQHPPPLLGAALDESLGHPLGHNGLI